MTKAVIFANGQSPFGQDSSLSVNKLISFWQTLAKDVEQSDIVIACDGAIKYLEVNKFLTVDYIVGDLDSLDFSDLDRQANYLSKLVKVSDQDTNDLTKAVNFAIAKGVKQVVIYGATGKREDHTLANIALLLDYICQLDSVIMKSQYGTFYPVKQSLTCKTAPNCQISIFSIDKDVEITSSNLKWPLVKTKLSSWWEASLNTTITNQFTIITNSTQPKVLVWVELE
ncbi:MAG: thiamine diphosphokinase [Bifidobacteriaceae bacterium]|jgi:thiamine pyrophosphokinase|nr:thiamine diphosphokinase [Bifidobacteriaceae bacterium]